MRVRSVAVVVRGVGEIVVTTQMALLYHAQFNTAYVSHSRAKLPFCVLSGLCPDWADWDPNKPVQNAREAMQQADDWLGVPQVRCMIDASNKLPLSVLQLSWVGLIS